MRHRAAHLPTTLTFAEIDPLSLETVQEYSPSRLPLTVSRLLYVVEVAFRSTWLMEYSGLLLFSVSPLRVHVTVVGGDWVEVQLRVKEGGWEERAVSRWNPTGVSRTGPPGGRDQYAACAQSCSKEYKTTVLYNCLPEFI